MKAPHCYVWPNADARHDSDTPSGPAASKWSTCTASAEQAGHTRPREQQLSKVGPRLCSLLSKTSSCSSLQLGMNGLGRLLLWGSTAVPLAFLRFMKKHQITQINPASLSNQVNHKYSPSHYNSAVVRKWRELNESGEKVYYKLLAVCDSLRT